MNKIKYKAIIHNGQKRIALFFEYNREIIDTVKNISGRRWSISLKCWDKIKSPSPIDNLEL